MTKIPHSTVPWPPPWPDAPQFGAGEPWPPYAYHPGLPHPRRHAKGHGFGRPEPVANGPIDVVTLHLRSVDLYHAGYFWEAHEGWEAIWRLLEGDAAQFVQALIQNSAAQLKLHTGQISGAVKLSRAAYARLSDSGISDSLMLGLDPRGLACGILRHYRPLWQGEGRAAGNAPRLPLVGPIHTHRSVPPGR